MTRLDLSMAPRLGPIRDLRGQGGKTGIGQYLLTGSEEHIGKHGRSYLRLRLEDATGSILGFVWSEFRGQAHVPALPAVVQVQGRAQEFDHRPQLRVEALSAVPVDQVRSATALLPRHRCPEAAHPAFDALAKLESALPAPLDGFLRAVLLDPAIALPLLRCRASVAHHHAFVGGLLVHSTAMLDHAARLAMDTLPNDATAPYLAQLGYLLHDLGKLRSVGEAQRPPHALVVRHEFLSIEMLAPHLKWLEQRDAGLATALRYVLSYLATPAKARPFSDYAVAEIVELLDQISAASHNGRDLGHLLSANRGRHGGQGPSQPTPQGASWATQGRPWPVRTMA